MSENINSPFYNPEDIIRTNDYRIIHLEAENQRLEQEITTKNKYINELLKNGGIKIREGEK